MVSSVLLGVLGLGGWAIAAVVQDSTQVTSILPFVNWTSATPVVTAPPSIPAITFPPLPPDFNDIPRDILECYDSWASANVHNTFIERQVSSLASSARLDPPSLGLDRSSWIERMCTTSPFTGQYTTLCDGLARNTERSEEVNCRNVATTYTWSQTIYWTTIIPEWLSRWRAENRVELPTCSQAPDREKLCYRLHSAYFWRSKQAESSAKANITQLPRWFIDAERPMCRTLRRPPPWNQTTKSCLFNVDDYQVYYWPSAPLTGSSFCMPNITRLPGGTRTIPWLPNTAVVSGLTLTSPSIYHFLKGVGVSTSIGAIRQGRAGLSPVYNLSSSIAPDTILTFPQEESDVWTVKGHRTGRGLHAHWEYQYGSGSYNADDMSTVRSAAYFGECQPRKTCNHTGQTISQAQYRQNAALSVKEVLNEWDSDEFQDCNWSSQYWQQGPWHDRVDMWIAPGQPWRAVPIMTDDEGEPEATRMAKPASTISSPPIRTGDWVPETTETGEPADGPNGGPDDGPE
ncbi:uncharacterized protein BDR25DRAFT_380985 [Lindgomyces ingoldianus]|uniref:Uncharacterized protein n=1 Tax=Lindgomyces ingoldianus TaxID=673940 RepID=A0ACB6QE80_9PLEO|nr:uncharacterized protein BDR25DRAFT_380985 [Lindgomyces ingoldianus]KAF2464667.1 hypothetical protein BDR25DRAFT_380985 [Lindgomyces ingoldianus]